MSSKRVGVIGLGRIGKRVSEMLKTLNVDVCGYDIKPDREWADKSGVKLKSLQEILKTSDILCLHVSILKDSSFVLGSSEISEMKKGAIIINTSRGQVVDEVALYETLKSGHLGGAGLDVFSSEPYYGPLCELDNVVLTPHISTLTEESRTEMEIEAVENLLRFFNLPF